MHSIPRWYIPLQSKLNMYRYSETLLKTRVANITQDQIDSSCLSFKFDNPPVLYGFGDKMVGYTTTNVIENSYGFNTRWEGGEWKKIGSKFREIFRNFVQFWKIKWKFLRHEGTPLPHPAR